MDDVDVAIIETLKSGEASRKEAIKDDKEELFGCQVAATLRRLSNKQKAMCKLHIQQVLVNVEFCAEDSQQTYVGVKCAIWCNGHLGNCNLAPYGAMAIKELKQYSASHTAKRATECAPS